jgi:type VI secretion system protein ImpE
MQAEEYIRAGRLEEALAELQSQIRANPADTRLRVYLFQLHSILGNWDKALTQLNLLADLGPETMMLAQLFRPVVSCEALRTEIFAGKRTPIIFGEPLEWIGLLAQANGHIARGEFKPAAELRDKAFEMAPAVGGKIDGQPFEWLADADTRLGPVLEVVLDGCYRWVPFCRIKRIHTEKPTDLRDLTWIPAQFVWTNGGEASGHIPTRYPGTETSKDNGLRMARKTEWVEKEGGTFIGVGQRVLATDHADYPLLECRLIDFEHAPIATS